MFMVLDSNRPNKPNKPLPRPPPQKNEGQFDKELDHCVIHPSQGYINNSITIVTGYYLLNKSEHTHSEYTKWFQNFLGYVRTPMIIFTDSATYETLYNIRSSILDSPRPKEITNGFENTIFYVNDLWNYTLAKIYRQSFEQREFLNDPLRKIPGIPYINYPEHYAIWNLKPWMLNQACVCNPFNSKYFFWVDSGSFRNESETKKFREWPDVKIVDKLFSNSFENKMLTSLVTTPPENVIKKWTESKGPYWMIGGIQGGFFGGTSLTVAWWVKEYYRLFKRWHDEGFFVGREEAVMTGFALSARDKHFMITGSGESCVSDHWFYFQQFVAHPTERISSCSKALEEPIRWPTYLPEQSWEFRSKKEYAQI